MCLQIFKVGAAFCQTGPKAITFRQFALFGAIQDIWQWIYYTSESKRSSAEWIAAGENIPKLPKPQKWTDKFMAP